MNLDVSSFVFSLEKSPDTAPSALKLLTTEKPFRQSLLVAVKLLLPSDTFTSLTASFLPDRSDTRSGTNVTPIATAVSNGE